VLLREKEKLGVGRMRKGLFVEAKKFFVHSNVRQ
jgi:hypothetical protein